MFARPPLRLVLLLSTLLGLSANGCKKPEHYRPSELQIDYSVNAGGTGRSVVRMLGWEGYAYPGLRPEEFLVRDDGGDWLASDRADLLIDTVFKEYLEETTVTLSARRVDKPRLGGLVREEVWEIDMEFTGSFTDLARALGMIAGDQAATVQRAENRLSVNVTPQSGTRSSDLPARIAVRYSGSLVESNASRHDLPERRLEWSADVVGRDGLHLVLMLDERD